MKIAAASSCRLFIEQQKSPADIGAQGVVLCPPAIDGRLPGHRQGTVEFVTGTALPENEVIIVSFARVPIALRYAQPTEDSS
jgi:hypothetical protein